MNFPDNSPIDLYCPSQLRLYFLPFLNWLFITLSLTDVLTAALCEWLFLSPGCKTLTQQFRFSRLKIFLRRQKKSNSGFTWMPVYQFSSLKLKNWFWFISYCFCFCIWFSLLSCCLGKPELFCSGPEFSAYFIFFF